MLLALTSLSGCAAGGPAPNSFCDVARPIYFAAADRLTEPTVRAIVAHNEKGAELCGWRPPS